MMEFSFPILALADVATDVIVNDKLFIENVNPADLTVTFTKPVETTVQGKSHRILAVWNAVNHCRQLVELSPAVVRQRKGELQLDVSITFKYATFDHGMKLSPLEAESIEQLLRVHKCGEMYNDIYPEKVTLRNVYASSQRLRVLMEDQQFLKDCEAQTTKDVKAQDPLMNLVDLAFANTVSYFDARDLNIVRSCSKHLNEALKGWVPGLRLRLFQHQVTALSWMEQRECSVPQSMYSMSRQESETLPGQLPHACWCPLPNGSSNEWWLNKYTRTLHHVPNDQRRTEEPKGNASGTNGEPVGVVELRGGLLCDEPGLGKTITVLSLILRSAGKQHRRLENLSNTENQGTVSSVSADDLAMQQAWFNLADFVRVNELINVRKALRSTTSKCRETLKTNQAETCTPTSLADAHWLLDQYDYFVLALERKYTTESSVNVSILNYIQSLQRELKESVATLNYFAPHVLTERTTEELTWLRSFTSNCVTLLSDTLVEVLQTCSRKLRSSGRQCGARIANDVRQRTKEEQAIESHATLIVVPKALLVHWRNQFQLHVDERYLSWLANGEQPLFFIEGLHNRGIKRKKDDQYGFPTAETLSKCLAVIVSVDTISRLASQEQSSCAEGVSPIAKVKWLRLIIDEGHSLGTGVLTGYGEYLKQVDAQRRWVMTGTPAKETTTKVGATSLLGLFRFLKFKPFGIVKENGRRMWSSLILKDLEAGSGVGCERLVDVLSQLMVRHTKNDVAEIPTLVRNPPLLLDMSDQERKSYNAIVSSARANIVLTGIGHKGKDQSLLHARQAKFARELVQNIRLACSGWGELRALISDKNYAELQDLLHNKFHTTTQAVHEVNRFVARATRGDTSECLSCHEHLLLLLVFPCGHQFCAECVREKAVEGSMVYCLQCSMACSGDSFANLQPGLELKWVSVQSTTARLAAGDVNASSVTRVERYTKGEVLITKLENLLIKYQGENRKRNHRHRTPLNDIHQVEEARSNESYPVDSFLRQSNGMNSNNGRGLHGSDMLSYVHGNDSSVASLGPRQSYGSSSTPNAKPTRSALSLIQARAKQHWRKQVNAQPKPLKVIVYSQFRQVLNRVASELIHRFGPDAIAEFWGAYRDAELAKFTKGIQSFWTCTNCGHTNDAVHRKCQRVRVRARYMVGTGSGPWLSQITGSGSEGSMENILRTFFVDELEGYRSGDSAYVNSGTIIVPSVSSLGMNHSGSAGRWVVVKRLRCKGKLQSTEQVKQRSVDCFVMLLSRDGSHGLDLSMANHVVVIDKIWDPAVEDQVVSRAWRLGATNPDVVVEELLMKDTVEHLMHDMEQHKTRDLEKLHFLLEEMRVVPAPLQVVAGAKQMKSKKKKKVLMWADQLEQS